MTVSQDRNRDAFTGTYTVEEHANATVILKNGLPFATIHEPNAVLRKRIVEQMLAFATVAPNLNIDPQALNRRPTRLFMTVPVDQIDLSDTVLTVEVTRPDDNKTARLHVTLSESGGKVHTRINAQKRETDNVATKTLTFADWDRPGE